MKDGMNGGEERGEKVNARYPTRANISILGANVKAKRQNIFYNTHILVPLL